jgi:hypothetical protein
MLLYPGRSLGAARTRLCERGSADAGCDKRGHDEEVTAEGEMVHGKDGLGCVKF